MQPNEVPEGPWQIVTSDLITGLPKCQGFDAIMVTSDRFTKQVHLTATTEKLTSAGAAELYLRDVWKLHGLFKRVRSD